MICTSIQGKTLEEILAILEEGEVEMVEMAEIRLDLCELDEEDIEQLFTDSDVPLIATCRIAEAAKRVAGEANRLNDAGKVLSEQGLYMSEPRKGRNAAEEFAETQLLKAIEAGAKYVDLYINLGHGVGSCIFTNGKAYLGSEGFSGEIGHTCIEHNGRLCGCGNKGCLETYCSATGIRRTALEMMENMPDYDGALRKVDPEELTSKMVGDAAKYGDPLAIKVFEKTGYLLGLCPEDCSVVPSGIPRTLCEDGGRAGDADITPLCRQSDSAAEDGSMPEIPPLGCGY